MDMSNIKIVFWNCRSIRNKILEFVNFLNTHDIDICLLSETWLTQANNLYHTNYSCIREDRIDQNGGGVAILVKKSITYTIIPKTINQVIENVGISIRVGFNSKLNIYSVYFPGGQNNITLRSKFKSDLRRLLNTDDKYIICGDLNSKHGNWNCLRANQWGNILNDFTTYFPVSILYPNSPTYIPSNSNINATTLDLILTNTPQFISNPLTINDLSSDHLPVSFSLSTTTPRIENLVFNFQLADWRKYSSYLNNSIKNNSIHTTLDSSNAIDDSIEYFSGLLLEAVRQPVPKVPPKTNYIKLPAYILRLMKIRNHFRREWERYRNPSDFHIKNNYDNLIKKETYLHWNRHWNAKLSKMENLSGMLQKY